MEQCEARGGRNILQVKQNFSLTVCPLTCTSLVLGGGLYAAPAPFPGCSISLSIYSASAMVALEIIFSAEQIMTLCYTIMEYLGIMPGSEKDVFSKLERTKMKRTAPTTGRAGLTL